PSSTSTSSPPEPAHPCRRTGAATGEPWREADRGGPAMKRFLLVGGVAWFLLGVAVPAARADMYEVQGRPGKLVLAVLKGEVWLFEGGVPEDASRDWGFVDAPGKHPLPLRGRSAWYLAFDAEGKSKRVRLASDRFTGTTWVFAKAEGGVTTY